MSDHIRPYRKRHWLTALKFPGVKPKSTLAVPSVVALLLVKTTVTRYAHLRNMVIERDSNTAPRRLSATSATALPTAPLQVSDTTRTPSQPSCASEPTRTASPAMSGTK